jgi:hypothetical protein
MASPRLKIFFAWNIIRLNIFEINELVMGRGLDGVVSPSTKNRSFAACEPFFTGYESSHIMIVEMADSF